MQPQTAEDARLFGRMIDRSWEWDGCWVWEGSTNGVGYGQLYHQGKRQYVHRIAYRLLHGPIPSGMVIDHLCRNTLCWNPAHLEPVTVSTNVRRGITGTKNHCKRGHEFTPANTYITPYGHRRCRQCRAERERARRRRLFGIGKDA